jgi:hypothetical protein
MSLKALARCLCCVGVLNAAGVAYADCIPAQMTKISFANIIPGVATGEFAAQPKTLYRLGAKYGRIEEAPDTANGIHGLIVVSEPDVWIANRIQKTGQHIVDTGAPYYFRAPIYSSPDSTFFAAMEFGCELVYITSAGAKDPTSVTEGSRVLRQYEAHRGNETISLLVDAQTDTPREVRFVRAGKQVFAVRYIEYQTLETDPGLFRKPLGISFQEPK